MSLRNTSKIQNYFLSSTGRARSGALNHSLRAIGCGNPNDYFLPERWPEFYENGVEGVRSFLESKRVNGFLGVRAPFGGHIHEMCKFLEMTFTEFIEEYMPNPKFVYVIRDPLRQAIELVYIKSHQNPECDDPVKAIRSNRRAVNIRIGQIIRADQAWKTFFDRYKIDPYIISVYDLLESTEKVVRDVCDFLGYTPPEGAKFTHGFVDDYSTLPVMDELYNRFLKSRTNIL